MYYIYVLYNIYIVSFSLYVAKYGVSRYSVPYENIINISIYWLIQLLIKCSSTHMCILIYRVLFVLYSK